MSMMFGVILDGAAYLATDKRGSYYNPETKKSEVIGDIENKITILDKHTVLAATGACFYTDPIQESAPLLWERAGGNINKFRIEIKNKYNAISRRKNMIPQDVLKDTEYTRFLCANFVIAHYDRAEYKPILYGLNDYNDFREIAKQEQNSGAIGSSALGNDKMWSVIGGIKASSPVELIKLAFMACSILEPAIGYEPEIFKINQEGVKRI